MSAEDWQNFYWYHCVDLGNGVVTDGDYDLRGHLPAYGFPDNMSGLRVLDVGRASGFFAFEFEHRGASVVATELESHLKWDVQGGKREAERLFARNPKVIDAKSKNMNGAFDFAHRALQSKVVPMTASVYDLTADLFDGQLFDLVFAGSIMSHVKNPVGAVEALLSVTKGTLVIAAPTTKRDDGKRAMYLNKTPQSWWTLTDSSLTGIVEAAGASRVWVVSHFAPHLKRLDRHVHHTVVHAAP